MNLLEKNSDELNQQYKQKINVLKVAIEEKKQPNATLSEGELQIKREKAHNLYKKKVNTLRHYLKGKGFHNALKALKFGEEEHSKVGTGYRKDKMTMNSKYEINDLTLSNVSYHYTSAEMKDIWIHLPTSYLVIRGINNKLIEDMKINGLAIVFVDENGNEL